MLTSLFIILCTAVICLILIDNLIKDRSSMHPLVRMAERQNDMLAEADKYLTGSTDHE